MNECKTLNHFIGICPALKEFRISNFERLRLREEEIINILNGRENEYRSKLANYIKNALNYRKFLINEFN